MKFNSFKDFHEYIRRYNSISLIELCSQECWRIFLNKKFFDIYIDWVQANTYRNYLIRLILLSSSGNEYRSNNINQDELGTLINQYFSWEKHTISNQEVLREEASQTIKNIQSWETSNKNKKTVRNWSLKLSDILSDELLLSQNLGVSLFMQRMVSLQNSGFGYPMGRISRTLKLISMMDNDLKSDFSGSIKSSLSMSIEEYFCQFISATGVFIRNRGRCDLNNLPKFDSNLLKYGITEENFKKFVLLNSQKFHTEVRIEVQKYLEQLNDHYQPYLSNHFLCYPFIELKNSVFFLPDPISLTESSWNQIVKLIPDKISKNLSNLFENYILQCFPISPECHLTKIEEVSNPSSSLDKRADFLVDHPRFYIVIECKNSFASFSAVNYFQPEETATLWCRMHTACEQISATIKALNLYDKPTVPLILSFYDCLAVGSSFMSILSKTDYFIKLGFKIKPQIHSLHEFEHVTYNRSLENWVKSLVQDENTFIEPDNQGHNYRHLQEMQVLISSLGK